MLDTNDNRPSLPPFTILFNNYPGHFPLPRLGKIPGFDPDLNDTLAYSIPEVRGSLLHSGDWQPAVKANFIWPVHEPFRRRACPYETLGE